MDGKDLGHTTTIYEEQTHLLYGRAPPLLLRGVSSFDYLTSYEQNAPGRIIVVRTCLESFLGPAGDEANISKS